MNNAGWDKDWDTLSDGERTELLERVVFGPQLERVQARIAALKDKQAKRALAEAVK